MASTPYVVIRGIILRETETREADKILTLLTDQRGKISVIARGARRKSCRYAACAQALVYSEWTLYQKGEWYYANEGATVELFAGLRTDLDAMALGFYFAELTEAVTTEEAPAGPLLRHLLNGLYALSTLKKPPALVKSAFELKLMSLWQTRVPTAGMRSRRSPCWTWCRAWCAARAAAAEGRRHRCAGTLWRRCAASCTETRSASTPSAWGRMPSAACPRRRRALPGRSWSGGSAR